jgi:hypothetical protein
MFRVFTVYTRIIAFWNDTELSSTKAFGYGLIKDISLRDTYDGITTMAFLKNSRLEYWHRKAR